MSSTKPSSCDTFVVLPPNTTGGVVFGKNSDRPSDEVQEVIHVPAGDYGSGEKVKCTYIEIDQVAHTYPVVLSKPAWMWGAEMGANECGVCIGNEAVWTKLNSQEDLKKKLLGMDLLRLGLERGGTAKEALDVICQLLETHGQGGPCAEGSSWSYHNSFLIADRTEAWILETAASHWAAEQITSGVRNISNELSIRTKIDGMSSGLKELAEKEGYWKPDEGDFDFAKAFSAGPVEELCKSGEKPSGRYQCGRNLLEELSANNEFSAQSMFKVLRDEESDICMTGAIATTGSQVSVLAQSGTDSQSCHWFTATKYPHWSIFKPFVFCKDAVITDITVSPNAGVKDAGGFVDRKHKLYKAHEQFIKMLTSNDPRGKMLLETLKEMESKCIEDVEEMLKNIDAENSRQLAQIFQHMAQLEMNFYSM